MMNNSIDGLTEFEEDILRMMNDPKYTGKEQICAEEYEKAKELAQKYFDTDNEEYLHRAYEIMCSLGNKMEYSPAMLWVGDFCENMLQAMEQAVWWYKKAADYGNAEGARCYADMKMAGYGCEVDLQEALKYYKFASSNGMAEASFVAGEITRNMGNVKEALEYYELSYKQGYELAKMRINQLK